ncbi:hypothetical protein ALC60_07593 [Trachymyrmex zeteki]|uniref:DDE Tnp4 domain-containing protein n=1 Tax=Mycetomoellerius zeteki TaxID=64791 RepID=A0A151WZH8_9HYME|nr:hypothetical protein ALC60_07593 [Trachymyrmex zeteki]
MILLSLVLKTILPWFDQEIIRSNMSIAFKNFNTTRIVMDCAEIRIEKPHCVKCRILTYSNYKNCHTIKWNVAVTPSGLIVHISSSYGGRASDKFIVADSGILNKLDPYDAVIVDRGFLIENECLQVRLIINILLLYTFSKKKPKLSKTEALRTAEIARARVHVERVIQRIREFSFMSDEVSWNLISYFDILIIVVAIVNQSAPVLNIDKFL